MNKSAKYLKIIEWSGEDNCFIGSCPELFYGGCHGDDPRAVFDELCQIVDEMVEICRQDGDPLPKPLTNGVLRETISKISKAA